ncbi:MAG: SctD/MshK family protein [Geminicoccaceae bacterium]
MSADVGSAFTIFIESGLHAGTVQRFSPGIYTLGSELDADIVLSDTQINAVHLIVEFDRHGLRLEPLQGPVEIDGESIGLEPGGERHLALPASFRIGDVVIKVTAPKDAVQTRRRRLTAAVAAGVTALTVVGFQVFGALTGPAPDGPTASPAQPAEMTQVVGGGDQGSTAAADEGQLQEDVVARDAALDGGADGPASPAVTLDAAAAALRERLAADGFSDIEVKTAVDRIVVRGEAEPKRMGEWQDVRIWFDGAFGQNVIMVASVEPVEAAEPPKLAIEAVWSGEDPYLIAGGQRFFVGAHIGDGWTIDRIGADEITFKRGGKSFSLAL